jgi:S1-C subfamily serine protease
MKTSFKVILFVGLLITSVSAFADLPSGEGFSFGQAGLPPVANEAWDATVQISQTVRNCANNNSPSSLTQMSHKWGTGVVVRYNQATRVAIIATNSHVIKSCPSGISSMEIGFLKEDSSTSHETTSKFEVLLDKPELDLALLKVLVPKKVQASVVKLGVPRSTELVIAIGYPDTSLRKDWNVAIEKKGKLLRRYSQGQIQTFEPRYPLIADKTSISYAPVILHTADILPGNSGGPLLNNAGELIGLNSRMNRHLPAAEKSRQGTNNYFYCANRPSGESDCQNLAISAELISKEVDKLID